MYIDVADLQSHIESGTLDALSFDVGNSNIIVAVNQAIGQLRSYLSVQYQIDVELAKTAAARDPLVLMLGMDLVIYHLFSYIDPTHIPTAREDRYKAAIQFLKDVQSGAAVLNILEAVDDTKFEIKGGSNVKRINQY